MKKTLFALFLIVIAGCANLNYETQNGTKVTYTRFFTTSDFIKGNVGDAKIEVQGQRNIDPETLSMLLNIMGRK